MALTTGAHVMCGYVVNRAQAKLFYPIWSETVAYGGTTSQSAPGDAAALGEGALVFRVRAPSSADIYVAASPVPNASQAVSNSANTVRNHLIASQEKDIPALIGWKCQVVAA